MMTLTHAIVGATTGRYVPNPYIVFALNTLLHFPLDKVPHFLPKSRRRLYAIMTIDLFLTSSFLFLVWFFGGTQRINMLIGALGGIYIDVLLVLTPFLKTKLGQWHATRQNHRAETYFYIIDLVTAVLLMGFWWVIK